MGHNVLFSLAALVASISLAVPAHAGGDKVQQGTKVMAGVEDRADGDDQTATVTLEIEASRGTKRLRRLVLLRKEAPKLTKIATYFVAPADLRGAAFLVWDKRGGDDERWLYLPAVGQVRRLATTSSRQSFFGSDFVYEDLTIRDPELDDHELTGSQKVDNFDCWVVDSKPRNARAVDFARYRSWVTKDGSVIARQEYFDSSGKVVRRIQAQSIKKVQGIWTLLQATAWNLRTNSRSRFALSDVKYNSGVADARMSDGQLNRGAP